MSYRDDLTAALARSESLARQLAEATQPKPKWTADDLAFNYNSPLWKAAQSVGVRYASADSPEWIWDAAQLMAEEDLSPEIALRLARAEWQVKNPGCNPAAPFSAIFKPPPPRIRIQRQ